MLNLLQFDLMLKGVTDLSIPILHEDSHTLVVNKPSGVLVHPDKFGSEPSLQDYLAIHYPELEKVGEPIVIDSNQQVTRFGIAHRLDKETSGVLLIAKNQSAFSFFKRQFKQRTIQKIYHAFVYGRPKQARSLIDRPIGRHSKDPRRRSTGKQARGELKEAQTTYIVERGAQQASMLKLLPHTGRTHQLRVHLSSIGHPIIADPLYAPGREPLLSFKRLALHAYSITFRLPQEAEPVTFSAPWPADFERANDSIAVDV